MKKKLNLQLAFKQLDKMEASNLYSWNGWINRTFRPLLRLPRFITREFIDSFRCAPGLNRILTRHIVESYQTGRQHGYEAGRIARKGKDIPKVVRLSNRPPDVDIFLTPDAAIEELKQRELYLAGVVENDIITGVKSILEGHLYGNQSPQQTQERIQTLLDATITRASLITTTETTYAYNRGRLSSFAEANVDYVRFSAVMDARTSPQCKSRHGLIIAMNDSRLASNTPPLHGRCRSVLEPIYAEYQPELLKTESMDWSNVHPLPSGWGKR